MKVTSRRIFPWLLAAVLGLVPAGVRAQDDDQPIRQSVARISFVEGDASYSRGDDPDDWQAAALNVPMTLGDRVYTADGSRLELQFHNGFVRLAPGSDLTALNLTDDIAQFSLTSGTASIRVRRLQSDDVVEIDTPNAAVTLDAPGDYRIDVDADGNSRVAVRRGESTIAAGGGQVPLAAGSLMSIQGFDNPYYDVSELPTQDSWDSWVNFRNSKFTRVASYQYMNADVVGAEDLDQYGRWDDVPDYGRCWTPSTVAVGWAPYRDGQWLWEDPWGWTWVGAEAWGWAPYHYGRWVNYSSRWYWVPVGRQATVTYSPALVAFIGSGPGFSAAVAVGGPGYVGWFPLAPRDPFIPWWGSQRNVNVNVTNVTYVNRSYVTVVNQNTFVSGAAVGNNAIRDVRVLQNFERAPVVRGVVPVVPTAASIRVAASAARPAPRPPAAIVNRSVVTRVAPPPAPATFQAKMRVIQQNRGAPVAPAAAARLSVEAHGGAKAAVPIRPAVAQQGRVDFAPRQAGAPRPQAITAPRGKALATADRPMVADPSAAARANTGPAPRMAPGAVAPAPPARGNPQERRPPPPNAESRSTPPPPAAAPPPGSENWRQRVPPGQERTSPPPQREAPPERAAPPARENPTEQAPPPRREVTPPPERPAPPPRRETPPPQRESPPPARQAAPPPERPAPPPPRAEGDRRANPPDRSQPPNRGNADKSKDKGKDKDKKKEPPPPPPPSL